MLNFKINHNLFTKYCWNILKQLSLFDIAMISFLGSISTYILVLNYTIFISALTQTTLLVIHLVSTSVISFYLLRSRWVNLFASILSLFVFSIFSSFFIDLGADSQTAHINSYLSILNGWDITSFEKNEYQIHGIKFLADTYQTYLAGRVPYVLFALSYSFTGFLDSGKGINLVLHFSSAVIFFNLFPLANSRTRLLFTFLVFMNPVSIAQLNTHYIDNYIFIGFILCTIAVIKSTFYSNELSTNHEKKMIYAILIASSVLLSGSKLPGVVYNITIVSGICFFYLFQRKMEYKHVIPVIGLSSLGSIIGGVSPYIIGLDFSNSDGLISIIDNIQSTSLAWERQSAWLNDTNTLQRLIHSIFSEYNGNPSNVPTFKFPGWVTINELNEIAKVHPDARIGGFGPLFSLSLCISIITMVYGLYINRIQYTQCACLFILIFLTSMLHPYSFWARWAPQIWILPLIVLLWRQHSNDTVLRKLNSLIVLTVTANIIVFSSIHLTNFVFLQKTENDELQSLILVSKKKDTNKEKNLIWFQNFHAWKFRLEEKNIPYQSYNGPLDKIGCLPINYGKINRSQVVFCKDE